MYNGWRSRLDYTALSEKTKEVADGIATEAAANSKFDAAFRKQNSRGFIVHRGHDGVHVVTLVRPSTKRIRRTRAALRRRKITITRGL